MKIKDNAGSLEAMVPADEHGSSCLPVVAQAAVPAESCDLRARIAEAEQRLFEAQGERNKAEINETVAEMFLEDLKRQYEATKTHVGGNVAISGGRRGKN